MAVCLDVWGQQLAKARERVPQLAGAGSAARGRAGTVRTVRPSALPWQRWPAAGDRHRAAGSALRTAWIVIAGVRIRGHCPPGGLDGRTDGCCGLPRVTSQQAKMHLPGPHVVCGLTELDADSQNL